MAHIPDIDPESGAEFAEQPLNAAQNLQEKTQRALRSGQAYVKQYPFPVILGAFLVGTVLGALLVYREPKKEDPDPVGATRDWLEQAFAQLKDRLPEKDTLVDQAQAFGKKVKWW